MWKRPIGNKKYGRRRYAYKKRYRRTAKGLAVKALKSVNYLSKKYAPEVCYFDLNENNVNVDYNGYIPSLCIPPQGDTDSQRQGDRIMVKNCTFRYRVERNGSDQSVRVMLIWDKQAKVSSSSDILEDTGAFANAVISPKNYDKRFQTEILYDKTIDLHTSHPIQDVSTVVKINKHTQFNLGTTTVTSGRLLAMFISNTNANTPRISYYSRCTFTD